MSWSRFYIICISSESELKSETKQRVTFHHFLNSCFLKTLCELVGPAQPAVTRFNTTTSPGLHSSTRIPLPVFNVNISEETPPVGAAPSEYLAVAVVTPLEQQALFLPILQNLSKRASRDECVCVC